MSPCCCAICATTGSSWEPERAGSLPDIAKAAAPAAAPCRKVRRSTPPEGICRFGSGCDFIVSSCAMAGEGGPGTNVGSAGGGGKAPGRCVPRSASYMLDASSHPAERAHDRRRAEPALPLNPRVFAILAVLLEAPAHGYRIKQEVEERSGGRGDPRPGLALPHHRQAPGRRAWWRRCRHPPTGRPTSTAAPLLRGHRLRPRARGRRGVPAPRICSIGPS